MVARRALVPARSSAAVEESSPQGLSTPGPTRHAVRICPGHPTSAQVARR
jgi:hypothetical protein